MRPLLTVAAVCGILSMCLACATPSTTSASSPASPIASMVPVDAVPHAGVITETFDEFRREGMVRARWETRGFTITALRVSTDPTAALLEFESLHPQARYLRCHQVDALADGEPVALPEFRRDAEVGHGMVFEEVFADVPIATLAAMGRASLVRFRICADELALDAAQLGTLRDFLARTPPTAARAEALPPRGPVPRAALPCGIPAGYVRVCVSSQGYRFALPYAEACPSGSVPSGAVQLTCDALRRPAYHACLSETGAWSSVHAWVSCAERGLLNAAGDFVPPGRSPAQGVAPDTAPTER